MRTKVFTERDRRLLESWLENGEETGETRKLFTQIRRCTLQLMTNLKLMRRVINELKRRRRWAGRFIGGRVFASE